MVFKRATQTIARSVINNFGRLLLNGKGWLLILLLLVCNNSAALAQGARVTNGHVEINGGKLYYEMAGRGHNVVLIHGGLADSRMWDDQFRAFAKHYRVLRYDLSCFGMSVFSMGPLS
ncbi:MAG: alpha/beta hydrolase, partial [Pyrinomonadaceae bacterium]|nr:alpha/beta hydrolase [Pyrinomonadaceae bacterium]